MEDRNRIIVLKFHKTHKIIAHMEEKDERIYLEIATLDAMIDCFCLKGDIMLFCNVVSMVVNNVNFPDLFIYLFQIFFYSGKTIKIGD